MDEPKPSMFKRGDRVRISTAPDITGRVMGQIMRFGPNNEDVYQIRLPRKPKPTYLIVLESQMEPIPATA